MGNGLALEFVEHGGGLCVGGHPTADARSSVSFSLLSRFRLGA
ncbi:MAG TPA: hypothetical protein VGQ57_15170 [Polyangiaceae bacterium]|nr:hypothetical protein [Polyangiaceae bacterium]